MELIVEATFELNEGAFYRISVSRSSESGKLYADIVRIGEGLPLRTLIAASLEVNQWRGLFGLLNSAVEEFEKLEGGWDRGDVRVDQG